MSRHQAAAAWMVAAALGLSACHGPLGPFAGGRLSGTISTEPSADWSVAAGHDTVVIETRPDDPYSVQVHYYVVGDQLYVEAMPRGWSRWRGFLAADPLARVRFGDRIYPVRAVPVVRADEIASVLPVFYTKDARRPPTGCDVDDARPPCVAGLRFFRLEPRPHVDPDRAM